MGDEAVSKAPFRSWARDAGLFHSMYCPGCVWTRVCKAKKESLKEDAVCIRTKRLN